MDWLWMPFEYEFMRYALLVGLLVGLVCPVMGTYLVVQRLGLLGDVVAHGVLPGLTIAHFLQLPLILGAFSFGMISTLLIAWIQEQSRVKADTAMAIAFSSFFSLGIVLITQLRTQLDLEALLFGDILRITQADLVQVSAIAAGVLLAVKLFYKELLFFTFDRDGAAAVGLPVRWIHWNLMAAITLTIVAGINAVGVILVIALMVTPAATAYLLVQELHWMMILGSTLGMLGSGLGMYVSYYWNLPCGPAIALILFGFFLSALLFSPSQGIVTRNGRFP